MKVEINVNKDLKDTQIVISCREMTADVEKIIAMLKMFEKQLTGKKDGQTFFLPAEHSYRT